jgi:hypothetical protein
LKVASTHQLTPYWYSRLRRRSFGYDYPGVNNLSLEHLLKASRNAQNPRAPAGEKAKVQSAFREWEVRLRREVPEAMWDSDWRIIRPAADSVRKQKRRWFLLNNVVKKLPGSVRVGLVKSDVRAFYAIKRKLAKRGAKHVSLGKFFRIIRSKSFEEKRWVKKRRRKR